ncbi:MAG: hemolysin III family protein [Clostridiales bacterium]|nr:hemolysin III family protein [Clostridiales bacterium]
MQTNTTKTRHHSLIHDIKDPGSAITHFIGMFMAILALPPLLMKVAKGSNQSHGMAFVILIVSMILLYGASTTYHTFQLSSETKNTLLKKLDHSMIFVMIAGSYTPICVIVLEDSIGKMLLGLVWCIAIGGIILKLCWIHSPKWLSSVIYILMGWTCLLAWKPILYGLTSFQFAFLLAGGIIYTIGGIIYALKLPIFNSRHKNFGSHEIFHLFVMGGSICHFIVMYSLA